MLNQTCDGLPEVGGCFRFIATDGGNAQFIVGSQELSRLLVPLKREWDARNVDLDVYVDGHVSLPVDRRGMLGIWRSGGNSATGQQVLLHRAAISSHVREPARRLSRYCPASAYDPAPAPRVGQCSRWRALPPESLPMTAAASVGSMRERALSRVLPAPARNIQLQLLDLDIALVSEHCPQRVTAR